MRNLNNLTVVIVTYKTSENIIFDCLKSINSSVKVLIMKILKSLFMKKRFYQIFQMLKYGVQEII